MITINLLPEDLRSERTHSSKQLYAIVASALISLLSFGFYLFVHFYELANAKQALEDAKSKRESLRKAEAEHAQLQKLIVSFKGRDQAVDAVKALRVSFSKKLHEFSNMLAKENHPIWITNLSILPIKLAPQKGQKATQSVGQTNVSPQFEWKSNCLCASDSLVSATNFYRAIKSDKEFSKDLVQIEVPGYTKGIISGKYQQTISWQFNVKMVMQIKKENDQKQAKK